MWDVPIRVPPRRKAVGDYRTPRRSATSRAKQVRQGLECASPLALWNHASRAVEIWDVPGRVPPRSKAVGGYRSPRRFSTSRAKQVRQGLECASPLALWNHASRAVEVWDFPMRVPPGSKAVGDYRSPRRFATSRAKQVRQGLECASPLALWNHVSRAVEVWDVPRRVPPRRKAVGDYRSTTLRDLPGEASPPGLGVRPPSGALERRVVRRWWCGVLRSASPRDEER